MILLYLFMLFLLLDILRLTHVIPADLLHNSLRGTLLVTGVIFVIFLYGNIHYYHKYRTQISATTEKPLAKPCKVLMLSDLHIGYHNQRGTLAKWVDMLNAENADLILIATGRQPNVDGLGLEQAGIEYSKRTGIATDENYQTNQPGIYAIGDVNAKCMLAHAAEFQGFHVVNHILGVESQIRHDVMPSAIFTHPEAASVGMTEDQCKEQGIAAVCKKAYFRANGKALAMNETEGMLKLIAREDDGRILGCHVYGAHAADLAQEVSALICRDTTVQQLKDMVHIHPTLSEIVHDAAMQF